MEPEFQKLNDLGGKYLSAIVKNATTGGIGPLKHPTNHKKIDAQGKTDKGSYYAAAEGNKYVKEFEIEFKAGLTAKALQGSTATEIYFNKAAGSQKKRIDE